MTGGAGEVIRGFQMLRVPLAAGSPVTRNLLVKRHEAKDPAEKAAAPRTLFVTHVDAFVTEVQLSRCFSGFGPVEEVVLKSVQKRSEKKDLRNDHIQSVVNFARVIFKEQGSLEKALSAATGKIVSECVLALPKGGLKEQLRLNKELYKDPQQLQQEVDTWMASYDAREEARIRAMKADAVDDDGFTKVVSGITRMDDGTVVRAAKREAKTTGAFAEPVGGVLANKNSIPSERRKKKKAKEMPDFYRFQKREEARQEVIDHRKRKADDEDTVERMKKNKRFKYMAASAG